MLASALILLLSLPCARRALAKRIGFIAVGGGDGERIFGGCCFATSAFIITELVANAGAFGFRLEGVATFCFVPLFDFFSLVFVTTGAGGTSTDFERVSESFEVDGSIDFGRGVCDGFVRGAVTSADFGLAVPSVDLVRSFLGLLLLGRGSFTLFCCVVLATGGGGADGLGLTSGGPSSEFHLRNTPCDGTLVEYAAISNRAAVSAVSCDRIPSRICRRNHGSLIPMTIVTNTRQQALPMDTSTAVEAVNTYTIC
jgi:hypothetical protein